MCSFFSELLAIVLGASAAATFHSCGHLNISSDHTFPLVPATSSINKANAVYVIDAPYPQGYIHFNQEQQERASSGTVRLHLAALKEEYVKPNIIFNEDDRTNAITYKFEPYKKKNQLQVHRCQSAEIAIDLPAVENAEVHVTTISEVKFQPWSAYDKLNKLSIKTISGIIDVANSNIGTKGLTLHSTSGDVKGSNVKVNGAATLSSVSGDIEVTSLEAKSQAQVSVTATSGDVILKDISVGGSLEVTAVSGDIEIHLKANSFKGSFRLNTTVGSLSIQKRTGSSDELVINNRSPTQTSGRINCGPSDPCDNAVNLHVSTMSGNVNVIIG